MSIPALPHDIQSHITEVLPRFRTNVASVSSKVKGMEKHRIFHDQKLYKQNSMSFRADASRQEVNSEFLMKSLL